MSARQWLVWNRKINYETNQFALSRQYDFCQLSFYNNDYILMWFHSSGSWKTVLFQCKECLMFSEEQTDRTRCLLQGHHWHSFRTDLIHSHFIYCATRFTCFTSIWTSFIIIIYILNFGHKSSSAHSSCEECLRLVTIWSMCVSVCVVCLSVG